MRNKFKKKNEIRIFEIEFLNSFKKKFFVTSIFRLFPVMKANRSPQVCVILPSKRIEQSRIEQHRIELDRIGSDQYTKKNFLIIELCM